MDPLFHLANRTVLVTGASSGIGRAVAVLVARQGGTVVATGRHAERLAETIAMLEGGAHRALVADLADAAQLEGLATACPPLHGLVHCAGIQQYQPMRFATKAEVRNLFAVNYEAPLFLTQALVKRKALQPGGGVVFVSSLAAARATVGLGAYSATKAALAAGARAWALELAGQRIRVNCVAPGMVRTPMAERMAGVISEEAMQEHEKSYPLGFGNPEDVAGAIVFLLADASRWMTGQTLVLDGGYSCR